MLRWASVSWTTVAAITFVLSLAATWLGIIYATRRRLMDLPGRRRSHATPTPRGGGIGIIVGVFFSLIGFAGWSHTLGATIVAGLLAAIALVALVGWIDDHRGLGAMPRIAAHAFATLLALGVPAMIGLAYLPSHEVLPYALACAVVFIAIVWSINLHNFMDGIDGLLALQALFVFAAIGALFFHIEHRTEAACTALLVAAVAGFVPFNFPRARIFMGDVGSGVLGLLIALVVLWQMSLPSIALASGIVLGSAFVIDATCTLLSRMLRGRRWYSAHREHLYQWLGRCGHSHTQVVALYMGWNLLIVLPVVCWMNRMPAAVAPGVALRSAGFGVATGVYAAGIALWWFGKRWCLRAIATRRRYAA